MTYGPLHLPQFNRQCDSKSWIASRLDAHMGPAPFSGRPSRSFRNIPPTPSLLHFFLPNNSGCVEAHASKTGGAMPMSMVPLRVFPGGTLRTNSVARLGAPYTTCAPSQVAESRAPYV